MVRQLETWEILRLYTSEKIFNFSLSIKIKRRRFYCIKKKKKHTNNRNDLAGELIFEKLPLA